MGLNYFVKSICVRQWRSIAFKTTKASPKLTRLYSSTEEVERKKYDQIRNDMIISTMKNRPDILMSPGLQQKLDFTWKSLFIGAFLTSATTMGLFVAIQLSRSKTDKESPRTAFVPLWVHLGCFSNPKFKFPQDLQLLDEKFYHCLLSELCCSEYTEKLECEHTKYKVLEVISLSHKAKDLLKLPVSISVPDQSNFNIEIESTIPVISGAEISIPPGSVLPEFAWQLKQFDYRSIIDGALVAAGLKLNRLETDAEKKTHEKSSGKIHEAILKKELSVHTPKHYIIMVSGIMEVEDKAHRTGMVTYEGIIDFDHLKINGGLKLTRMDLKLDGKQFKIK